MTDEPSNHASKLARAWWPLFGTIRRWNDEVRAALTEATADGFVTESQRFVDQRTSYGVQGIIDGLKALVDVSDGPLAMSVEQVIAVRGDRLAVCRQQFEFVDGSVIDRTQVWLFDTDLRASYRCNFETDEEAAAIVLLDELHAAHPEPVEPGACELAVARLEAFKQAVERANATAH